MKKFIFLICLILCLSVLDRMSIYAQGPQGRRPSGDRSMNGPPGTMNNGQSNNLFIENFPDIPYLSIKNRAKVETVMINEKGLIDIQTQKKQKLMEKEKNPSISEKKKNKIQKNIEKKDQKIKQTIDKSNKKVKKIITNDQYQVFIEKRGEFRFQKVSPMRFNGNPQGRSGGGPGRGQGGRSGGGRP